MDGWKDGCIDKSVLNIHLTIEAMLNLVFTLFLGSVYPIQFMTRRRLV